MYPQPAPWHEGHVSPRSSPVPPQWRHFSQSVLFRVLPNTPSHLLLPRLSKHRWLITVASLVNFPQLVQTATGGNFCAIISSLACPSASRSTTTARLYRYDRTVVKPVRTIFAMVAACAAAFAVAIILAGMLQMIGLWYTSWAAMAIAVSGSLAGWVVYFAIAR